MQTKRKSVREVTETILEWEKRFPVDRIQYGKLRVWPLLRLCAILAIHQGAGLRTELPVPQKRRKIRKGKKNAFPSFESLPEIKAGSVLFWAQSSKFVEQPEDPFFHRFFDPLLRFADEPRSDHTFWIWEDGPEVGAVKPDEMVTINDWLGPLIVYARKSPPTHRLNRSGRRFLDAWNAEADLPEIEIEAFELTCHKISIWAKFFEQCLEFSRPNGVILTCFYAELTMALTLACSRLAIPCVELQHGQQGNWHSMYTHWSKVPRKGYDLIPDQFWMWGEAAADRVRSWLRGPSRKVFVGGNPWLAWRVKTSIGDRKTGGLIFPEQNSAIGRTILISLQFSELPDFVWDTIARRRCDCWLLRLHPRFLADESSFIAECEKRLPHGNWEVERSSRADFYDVLTQVDIHVTGWSTTAYEALAFDVPTILIDPNGLDAMRGSIDEGVFGYSDDEESFSELLDTPPAKREEKPTMISDSREVLAAWNSCRSAR